MSFPMVILVRAGATDFDTGAVERVRAWTDVPLNQRGEMQADRAAQTLFVHSVDVDQVVSSDLVRARDLAARIDKRVGEPPLEYTEGLRPWNLGDLSAQTLRAAMPEIRRLLDHVEESAPNGESFLSFQERALGVLLPLLEESENADKTLVIITHSRVIRLIKGWIMAGCDPSGTVDIQAMIDVAEPAQPGQILVMQYDGSAWTLNDESALNQSQQESEMRDPFEGAVNELLGFDYGGLFQGLSNMTATGIQQAQQSSAQDQKRRDDAASIQKAIEADHQWAAAEATLEMSPGNPAAQTMRDLAASDAVKAASALQGDGQDKRCQSAQDALRHAAEAAAKSPKDASKQASYHAWQKVANACGGGAVSDVAASNSMMKHAGDSWLTTKHGPLPGYAWVGAGVVVSVLGILLLRRKG